jgi:hypothetical protein
VRGPGQVLLAVADEPAGSGGAVLAALRAKSGWLREIGWQLAVYSYAEVLSGIPAVRAGALCLLHFPYRYWDTHIEGKLPESYGTGRYGSLMTDHLLAAGAALRRAVPDGLRYVNPPCRVALTRDKIELKARLAGAGIPVPRSFEASTPDQIMRLLAGGTRLYIKAAYGSMGKGIIVASGTRWQTNYCFDGHRLLSGASDGRGGWLFHDVISGRGAFLAALCDTPGFLVEEAVATGCEAGGRRTEARVTITKGQVIAAEIWTAPAFAATVGKAEGGRRVAVLCGPGLAELPAGAAAAATGAAASLGLDYAVIDIVLDASMSPFVVDVQAFPALGTDASQFRRILAGLLGVRTPAPPSYKSPQLTSHT